MARALADPITVDPFRMAAKQPRREAEDPLYEVYGSLLDLT